MLLLPASTTSKSQAATRKQGTKGCGADVSPVSLDMSQSALQEAIERGYTGITTMLMKATAEVSCLVRSKG